MSGWIETPADSRWPNERQRLRDAAYRATVVWDFDGVIGDTEPLHSLSYEILLKRRDYYPEPDFFRPMVGNPEPVIWERLRDIGAPVDRSIESLILERREVFLALAVDDLELSWLADNLVEDLHSIAETQLVVSNGDRTTIERLLAKWEVAAYLDIPVKRAGQDKEDIFRKALSGRHSVTLEDSPRYLEIARRAGSFCVAVRHSMSPEGSIAGDVEVEI